MDSSKSFDILQFIIDNIKNIKISESEKFEAIKVIKNLYSNKQKVQCDKCQNWVLNVHLTLSAKNLPVILAYGLTKDPESNSYMIVMESVECNLRSYLQDSIENLTWLQKYKILLDISLSLECVHDSQLIHRDLHPGN